MAKKQLTLEDCIGLLEEGKELVDLYAAENAKLREENKRLIKAYGAVSLVAHYEAEIAKLRKVVDAAQVILSDALCELDKEATDG